MLASSPEQRHSKTNLEVKSTCRRVWAREQQLDRCVKVLGDADHNRRAKHPKDVVEEQSAQQQRPCAAGGHWQHKHGAGRTAMPGRMSSDSQQQSHSKQVGNLPSWRIEGDGDRVPRPRRQSWEPKEKG